jgi:hypothetical protein
MPLTNPQTLTALRELGCLVENDRVNLKALADQLAEMLHGDHIAASLDTVESVQVTVGQLATALVGDEDPELVEVIRPLLSGGPTGKVQQALTNGYMLCTGRVRIEVSIEGEVTHKSIGTRFLSAEHDVIEQYVLGPRERRVESLANSTEALQLLVAERQPDPDMAERLGRFTDRLKVHWRKALGNGDAA